jgi:hypothetical protein
MTKNILLAAISLFTFTAEAQKLATLKVSPNEYIGSYFDYNVNFNLDEITFLPASQLTLIEVNEGQRKEVPYQIENGKNRILHWQINAKATSGSLSYDLIKKKPSEAKTNMKIEENGGLININRKGKTLFSYQYETMPAPQGIDKSYGRSGFIHPLNTPNGEWLTRIQPKDHYHHYGIWNPWTHVLFEGDTLDFWNLNKKEATVRFAHFLKKENGAIYADYAALHEHVVLKNEKVALNEIQNIRTYLGGEDYYLLDFSLDLNTASKSPFHILEYRYAGFGWRTTEEWNNKNSKVLTSEGKTRENVDGSTAKWCIVQGALGDNYGGAIMMSHPTNFNHPEPLRIWPVDQYGRGDMFANFAPTKNMDWVLEPGKTNNLKYRMLIFNGEMTADKAEAAWQQFAYPIKIEIVK